MYVCERVKTCTVIFFGFFFARAFSFFQEKARATERASEREREEGRDKDRQKKRQTDRESDRSPLSLFLSPSSLFLSALSVFLSLFLSATSQRACERWNERHAECKPLCSYASQRSFWAKEPQIIGLFCGE